MKLKTFSIYAFAFSVPFSSVFAQSTIYPLTVENCGYTLTFESANAMVIDQKFKGQLG